MPLQKLTLRPGVNRETTNYANEGGFFSVDKVRFRGGNAQKIGGWQNITSVTSAANTFKGVAKAMWNYVTSLSQNLLAVGTNQKVYVELGGVYNDITPIRATVTLGNDPITTTDGSRLVEISATAHGVTVGTYINISGATAVGGITLSGSYEIVALPDDDTFYVVASSAATSTATGGGAAVVVQYDINAGPAVATQSIGWGGPPWGQGGWGSNIAVGVPQRLWSMFNYGDDLIFAEREGAIYYWGRDTTTWARAITLGDKANTVPKISTTATFSSGATTIVVPDASNFSTGMVISGSGIPAGAFITTAWTGTTSLTISAPTTDSATVAITASYAGRHVPNETLLVIDSSVNDFTICMGSNPYSPVDFGTTFDPLLVRWSDQGNPYEWVPQVINQSGEQRLSNGSMIMAAVNTRQEIVILTDTAVFSMQYIGPPFVWGITLLDQEISVASQNAVIAVNNSVYWMGTDKFYVYNGRVQTLDCTLRQHVFATLNRDQLAQVVSGHNEPFSEVWWFYPGLNDQTNSLYVIYNYLENVWTYGSLYRSAYVPQTLRNFPMMAFSVQNSYLGTAIDATQTTISLLDATSYPTFGVIIIGAELISYTGLSGNLLTGCVRGFNGSTASTHAQYDPVTLYTPNQVMFHEVGWDDQSNGVPLPINSFIETSDFDIGDGDSFMFVSRIIPDVKFLGSDAASPSITLTVFPHDYPGAAYGVGDSDPVTASVVLPVERYTNQVFTRIRGRQIALRVSSNGLGVAWQMGNMRLDLRPDGRR
jgi:hypothetical protein